eukprot:913577-Pyramimonas_sp.AAC.1
MQKPCCALLCLLPAVVPSSAVPCCGSMPCHSVRTLHVAAPCCHTALCPAKAMPFHHMIRAALVL